MKKNKEWVIITGASSGIGKALALEFAGKKFNVFLTGRDRGELKKVAAECKNKFHVDTKIFKADLSDDRDVRRLISALNIPARQYGILVNNAGFGVQGNFASTSIEQELNLIHVQINATLQLTKAILPSMIARRRGRILNIGSIYSFFPVPLQSVYGASKAFLLSFSSSLRNELAGKSVSVTLFCPGITRTKFRPRAGITEKAEKIGMTAESAARTACKASLQGKHIVISGLVNRIIVLGSLLIPISVFPSIIKFINKLRGHRQ